MTGVRDALAGTGKVFFLIAGLFLVAGILRLNDLTLYTPDSARYVIWGNSIASGRGYVDDTQVEEQRFVVHAPLYSALIAPVEVFFPLGVEPVKLLTLCWGVAALLLLWVWLRSLFGVWGALAGVVMLACNPLFLVYSTEPLSEVPFIVFFLFVILGTVRWAATGGRLTAANWILLVAAAALIGLLREIGVVIWLCLAGWLLLRDRKKALMVFAAGVVALGGWYIRNAILVGPPPGAPGGNAALIFQHLLTGADEPIIKELLLRVRLNLGSYGPDLLGTLFYPFFGPQHVALTEHPVLFPPFVKWSVVVLFGGVILRGAWTAARTGPAERFVLSAAALYLLGVAVYPVHDVRFMVPLLPVLIFLLLAGIRSLAGAARLQTGLVLGASLLVLVPNLFPLSGLLRINGAYRASPTDLHAALTARDEYPFYYTQPWRLLKSWIDTSLPAGAVLATPTKELALVSGGRKVMELDPGLTQSLFERLLRINGVTHLLAPVRWRDMKVYEFLMRESRRLGFEEVFAVSNLHVMKIVPAAQAEERAPSAGSGAADLLRSARKAIRAGDYARALDLLSEASDSARSYPEIRYQTVIAHTLAGDAEAASAEFERLMALPQVASYIFPARYYLSLMKEDLTVRALPAGPERSMRTLDLSRKYWDNGYIFKAREMLTSEMRVDSEFFVGYLWAFHFNFQTGRSGQASYFLGRLDSIDSTNSLVQNFHKLTGLRREVLALPPSPERAAVRLRMAAIYRDIELFDEAYDEGEAAAAEDPGSDAPLLFLADLYNRQGYGRRALSIYTAIETLPGDHALPRERVDSLRLLYAPAD